VRAGEFDFGPRLGGAVDNVRRDGIPQRCLKPFAGVMKIRDGVQQAGRGQIGEQVLEFAKARAAS